MKKVVVSVLSVLLLAVMLVSCKSGGPKDVAEEFLTDLYHMDFASAKEFATEETKKQLKTLEDIVPKMTSPEKKELAKKIKVTVREPKIEGDNATVEYTLSNDPGVKTLRMVKQDGKWLAQWSKIDLHKERSAIQNSSMSQDTPLTAPPADAVPVAPADSPATK